MTEKPSKPSPNACLGPSPIERRYKAAVIEHVSVDEAKDRLSKAIERGVVKVGTSSNLKRTGRPSTTGKPWEALGISRQAYYKRKKKDRAG